MTSSPPIASILIGKHIPHRVFQHESPPRSVEKAAEVRGQTPDQVVRSILFRMAEDEYLMVLMAGPEQIDWGALRRYLGVSRITMANKDDVLRVTGYPIGAVAPLGLPRPIRILVDDGLLALDEISLGSGVRGTAILMQAADLLSAIENYEIGKFGQVESL
ncbi:MAG: YbaK/EbsC family protein [Chloroflexi bacterium]|jgi:Cys-tRNA(Pro)/Cys-tRNA(Cys) deacylase|nr:YbaK/EbsC family protein [Chloroflexota bacterium]